MASLSCIGVILYCVGICLAVGNPFGVLRVSKDEKPLGSSSAIVLPGFLDDTPVAIKVFKSPQDYEVDIYRHLLEAMPSEDRELYVVDVFGVLYPKYPGATISHDRLEVEERSEYFPITEVKSDMKALGIVEERCIMTLGDMETKNPQSLPLKTLAEIFYKIVKGLLAFQAAGVVHLDARTVLELYTTTNYRI